MSSLPPTESASTRVVDRDSSRTPTIVLPGGRRQLQATCAEPPTTYLNRCRWTNLIDLESSRLITNVAWSNALLAQAGPGDVVQFTARLRQVEDEVRILYPSDAMLVTDESVVVNDNPHDIFPLLADLSLQQVRYGQVMHIGPVTIGNESIKKLLARVVSNDFAGHFIDLQVIEEGTWLGRQLVCDHRGVREASPIERAIQDIIEAQYLLIDYYQLRNPLSVLNSLRAARDELGQAITADAVREVIQESDIPVSERQRAYDYLMSFIEVIRVALPCPPSDTRPSVQDVVRPLIDPTLAVRVMLILAEPHNFRQWLDEQQHRFVRDQEHPVQAFVLGQLTHFDRSSPAVLGDVKTLDWFLQLIESWRNGPSQVPPELLIQYFDQACSNAPGK